MKERRRSLSRMRQKREMRRRAAMGAESDVGTGAGAGGGARQLLYGEPELGYDSDPVSGPSGSGSGDGCTLQPLLDGRS